MCIEHEKAAVAALSEEGSGLCRLLLFLGASLGLGLFGLLRFLHRLVELLGHELDAVLLDTVLVGPLFGLQIPLDGEQRTFFSNSNDALPLLRQASTLMKADTRLVALSLVSLRPIAIGKRATSLLVNVRISASFATKPVMMKEFSTCFMTVSF